MYGDKIVYGFFYGDRGTLAVVQSLIDRAS